MSKRSATKAAGAWVLRLVAGAVAVSASSCASGADEEPEVEWGTSEEDLRFSYRPPPAEYFRFTPDSWESDSPAVGGYHIEALNRFRTRCADGSFADTCYVAQLRMQGIWPRAASHIVRGYTRVEDFGPFGEFESLGPYGEYGVFIGDKLWAEVPGTDEAEVPEATFYRVSRAEVECRKSSCPTLRVGRLNSDVAHWATELDISRLSVTAEQAAQIHQLAVEDELIVNGEFKRERFRLWPKLVVSRVFLPPAVTECASDADCFNETWCRATQTGGHVCEPVKRWGEECGGLSGIEERCAFGDGCDTSPFPSVPPVCRPTCKGSCYGNTYCSNDGCRPPGTCEMASDCLHQANAWEHSDCPGYPTCEPVGNQAFCVWHCGNPACVDATRFRLGGCGESFGYGRFGGQCREVLGCVEFPNAAPDFAETMEECETQCL